MKVDGINFEELDLKMKLAYLAGAAAALFETVKYQTTLTETRVVLDEIIAEEIDDWLEKYKQTTYIK